MAHSETRAPNASSPWRSFAARAARRAPALPLSPAAPAIVDTLAHADGRVGACELWSAVVAHAAALHRALREAAGGAPPDLSAELDSMLLHPLAHLPDARDGVLVTVCGCGGSLAVQAPTPGHRELAATCAGGDDPDAWRAAVARWASIRTARGAADELQAWGLPAMPVDETTAARRAAASTARMIGERPMTTAAGDTGPARAAAGDAGSARAGAGVAAQPAPLRRTVGGEGGPLGGIRVIELGGLWAAPYATRLLGRLGAEVVKVEAPMRRDGARGGPPAHYAALNAGKRELLLDLRRDDDRDRLLALLGPRTVVVENFTGRVLGNLGLAPERILATGAALVRLPASRVRPDLRGLGSTIELAAGLGLPDPTRDGALAPAPIPFTDALSGVQAAVAAVEALRGRSDDERLRVVGQLEDVAGHMRNGGTTVSRSAAAGGRAGGSSRRVSAGARSGTFTP